jgi:hypothetical protein
MAARPGLPSHAVPAAGGRRQARYLVPAGMATVRCDHRRRGPCQPAGWTERLLTADPQPRMAAGQATNCPLPRRRMAAWHGWTPSARCCPYGRRRTARPPAADSGRGGRRGPARPPGSAGGRPAESSTAPPAARVARAGHTAGLAALPRLATREDLSRGKTCPRGQGLPRGQHPRRSGRRGSGRWISSRAGGRRGSPPPCRSPLAPDPSCPVPGRSRPGRSASRSRP